MSYRPWKYILDKHAGKLPTVSCPEVLVDYTPSFLIISSLAGKQDIAKICSCARTAVTSVSGSRPEILGCCWKLVPLTLPEGTWGGRWITGLHTRPLIEGIFSCDCVNPRRLSWWKWFLCDWLCLWISVRHFWRKKKKKVNISFKELHAKVSLEGSKGYFGQLRDLPWKHNYFWYQGR